MAIKVREEFQQHISPRDFWIPVVMVAALLGYIGYTTLVMESAPKVTFSSTSALILLNASWAFILYGIGHKGWRAFPWYLWVAQAGWNLHMATYVFPNSVLSAPWVDMLAMVTLAAGTLPQFLRFTRKPAEPSAERTGSTV